MQQIRSSFVTVPGLVILLLLSFAAAYLGIGLLFDVLIAFFLLCLCSRLWTDFSLRKIEVTSANTDIRAFPGDILDVPVSIYNGKFLPLVWLSVDIGFPENSCIESAEDAGAVFSWIMPHQRLSWNESARALRRGIYKASEVRVMSGDGFGLASSSDIATLENSLEIVVYPKLVDVNVSMILKKLTEFETSRNGFYTDPTLIKSTRAYMPGDSFRDLNWRLLARQGVLVVNLREKQDAMRLCILLDIESFSETIGPEPPATEVTYRLRAEAFEEMLSLAASVIDRASQKGALCSLVVPSYGSRSAEVVIPDEKSMQTDILLKTIAGIDYVGGKTELPFDMIDTEYHSLGQIFCFTGSAGDFAQRAGAVDLSGMWFVSSSEKSLEHVIDRLELLL